MKKIQIKQPALTAISYLIPVVVAGGFLLAIGNIMGGKNLEAVKGIANVWDAFSTMGGLILGMLPVVVSTGVAFAIADKPGLHRDFWLGLYRALLVQGFWVA